MHLAAVEGYYKVLLKMAACRDVDTNATNDEGLTAIDQNWLGVELRINLKVCLFCPTEWSFNAL